MEIGPIPGIRAMPVQKARPAGPELMAVFDIKNLARIGDETYRPSGGKQASAAEDVENEEEFAEEADAEEADSGAPRFQPSLARGISFFA